MSEFQHILSSAQLTKHYEVIQFLTQHPNQAYTLAQLDTLLPHGVAVQRFPEEWFDLIACGACWHRSIELQRPSASDSGSPVGLAPPEGKERGQLGPSSKHNRSGLSSVLEASAALAQSQTARRTKYLLSCVKSEIKTLEELRSRLESPSTLLDVEGCVALHTDQILISPELILRAQRTGLVYYFPDSYDKSEYRQFGMKDNSVGFSATREGILDTRSSGGGGARSTAGHATAALLDSFVNQEESSQRKQSSSISSNGLGSGSRDRTYVALPPGVRVQHQLLTRRGVPEQEDYCLPTRMYVGERLRLVFNNAVAVKKLNQKNELKVQLSMAGVKLHKSEKATSGSVVASAAAKPDTLMSEPPPPLRIRQEAQPVRHVAAASTAISPGVPEPVPTSDTQNNICTIKVGDGRESNAPDSMPPPAPLLISTTTKVEMEAMYSCTFTLLLTVNGVENIVAMEVMEEVTTMPGVLILRDRQLDSFALPQQDMLMDPLVNPPLGTHYPFEAIVSESPPLHALSSSFSSRGQMSSVQRDDFVKGQWSELVPLPWVQNPSPVVMSLRELTYPRQHATVLTATRTVFSAQSLADEARLRQTKEHLRREAARSERGSGTGGKRRRLRYRYNMIISNRHLLHFGLDFSIPFTRQPN